ncbi:carboxymuconolactone decarboxylase family protein [Methanofollis fontis]|uniref:Carboxymuconolactone decarboxylase family protein n=1 Tax=Methanofollis fontis TaxID=2052832 RepID=A0A483CTM6_9EURY|nr:carboxymuconolactone decarboxylase family protein [Methanofollis fontis]TAJ45744.1 carboxymuconolactone decarboxylase family protein [Methanofollis fontis]
MNFEEKLAAILEGGAGPVSADWLREIEEEFGLAPLILKRMGERPPVLLSHLLYKSSVFETSHLDPKYIELISLAVGAALKCRHCVEYHMQAAMAKGATRDEILEVILIAGLASNASVLADAYRVMGEEKGDEPCISCGVSVTNGRNGHAPPPADGE